MNIDSCIEKTPEKEIITDRFLCGYVLGILYKTNYFYNEIYYSNEEREIIRKYLYRSNEEKLDSINDLKLFLKNTNKSDIKKVLKKIPYGINN